MFYRSCAVTFLLAISLALVIGTTKEKVEADDRVAAVDLCTLPGTCPEAKPLPYTRLAETVGCCGCTYTTTDGEDCSCPHGYRPVVSGTDCGCRRDRVCD